MTSKRKAKKEGTLMTEEHPEPEFPMVHHTHADLLFRLNMEVQWKAMVATRQDVNMRQVWVTPQYQTAITNMILDELNKYRERSPELFEPNAGIELYWEPPVIMWDEAAGRYVAVPYGSDRHNWPLLEELVNSGAWSQ